MKCHEKPAYYRSFPFPTDAQEGTRTEQPKTRHAPGTPPLPHSYLYPKTAKVKEIVPRSQTYDLPPC